MSYINPTGRETDETTPFVADDHRDVSEERTTTTRPSLTPNGSQYDRPRPTGEHHTEAYKQEKPAATHIPWQHKLSLMNTLLMGLVALLIPTAVGFLAFLWSYRNGGNVNSTFYRIVVGGWIVQAVTITSVVLRFAVSTSAGIATSMLAALALEVQGTNLRSAASVSILRFVNSGPQSLLLDLKHSWKHNWRSSATASLLFLTTLLLQFTSTLLASDLGDGFLIGPEARNTTNTRITQGNLDLSGASVFISGTPREFPLFAELHSGGGSDPDSTRDTGVLLRGLLPFPSSAIRTSIEAFSGQSTILDSRVVCVRPQIHEEMIVMYDYRGESWLFNGTWLPEGTVEGLLPADFIPNGENNNDPHYLDLNYNNATFARYNTQRYNLNNDGSQTAAYAELTGLYDDIFALEFFETVVKVPSVQNDQAWTLSFMPLESGPVLLSALDPRYPFTSNGDVVDPAPSDSPSGHRLPRFKQNDPVALLTGTSYMVVNITNGDPTKMPPWNSNASDLLTGTTFPALLFATYEKGFANLVLTPRGEWLTYSLPEYPGWEASISLCYDSLTAMDLQVNMTTNRTIAEPSLGLFNDTAKHFNTTQILTQLDYARAQTDTMVLTTSVDGMRSQLSPSYNTAVEKNVTTMDLQDWLPSSLQAAINVKDFYIICEGCTESNAIPTIGDFEGGVFGEYNHGQTGHYVTGATQQIFIDVIQKTGNIGLALSDYMTILARAMYYDTLPYFDIAAETTFHQFESGLIPKRFTGFIIVLGALLVHICIVTAITIVFLTRTHVSRIGDAAWQAVAQVHFQELRSLLPEALMASDASFEKRIANAGLGRNIASFSSGKYEAIKGE